MDNEEKATQFKNLGNEAFKNKKYQEAITYFNQAIECNPSDHTFFSNRASCYINIGQFEKALEDSEKCIQINPNWARGYQRKGNALFGLQEFQQAVEAYKQGLKYDPQNKQLQEEIKRVEQEQVKSSQNMLNLYLKLANDPEMQKHLSDPNFMQKIQTVMQNPQLMPMFANDPIMKKAFDIINSPSGQNNFNVEEMLKKMGQKKQQQAPQQKQEQPQQQSQQQPQPQPQKMEEEAPSSSSYSPKQPQKQQSNPAEDAKNEGNSYYKLRKFNQALQFYQKAIDLNPAEPLYHNNKAAAYIQLGRYEEAHQQLDKADKIFEQGLKDYIKKAKILARRGSLYAKEGKYQQSINAYEKSLLEDGVQKIRDQLKSVIKLKKQIQQKEYLNPELGEKACEAGNSLFKEGKFPAALKQYEEAIKRNPTVAKYYSNLGTVYIKLMEWQRAKENFDIAIKKDPNFIKAYPKKGDCHYYLKQYHKALETYEAGLKIDPKNELCKAGVLKTEQAIYSSSKGGSEEEKMQRAKKAMADPEIQKILQTPEVRNALADLQSNPNAIQNIMKNPSLAEKIQKLIQAGVIGTG